MKQDLRAPVSLKRAPAGVISRNRLTPSATSEHDGADDLGHGQARRRLAAGQPVPTGLLGHVPDAVDHEVLVRGVLSRGTPATALPRLRAPRGRRTGWPSARAVARQLRPCLADAQAHVALAVRPTR